MKFEVTNPKIWKRLAETNLPMAHKVKIYEKLGGAYRMGEDGGEQVFNKMTELVKYKNSLAEGKQIAKDKYVVQTDGNYVAVTYNGIKIGYGEFDAPSQSYWIKFDGVLQQHSFNALEDIIDYAIAYHIDKPYNIQQEQRNRRVK